MPKLNQVPQAADCPHVTISVKENSYRLSVSSTLFEDRKQKRIALGIKVGAAGSLGKAQDVQREVQKDINEGRFDPANVRKYQGDRIVAQRYPTVKRLTLGELWQDWLDRKSVTLAPSTCCRKYTGTLTNCVYEFGSNTRVDSDNALALRNWLMENRARLTTIELLRELEKATKRAIEAGKYNGNNPFLGLSEEINNMKSKDIDNRTANEIVNESNKIISYSKEEMDEIIECFRLNHPKYYLFVLFRYRSGARISESVEIRWRDITDDFTKIAIARSYDQASDSVKNPKNGKIRIFNCDEPLIEELADYYHSLSPIPSPDDLVFTNSKGKRILPSSFARVWNKVVKGLADNWKIAKALPPKHTRHTFATMARLAGYSRESVARQLGHSPSIEDRHYIDRSHEKDEIIRI